MTDGLLALPVPSNNFSRFLKSEQANQSLCSVYSPNFHFAVVICCDENEYVTLENFAVSNPSEINDKWKFLVYQMDNENSYHGKLQSSGGYGNACFSLIIR